METNFSDRLVEPSYYTENNSLILVRGKDGVVINTNKLKSEIVYIVNNLNCKTDKPNIFNDSTI